MFKYLLSLATALVIVAAEPCFAHANLQSSSPAANAVLTESPRQLTLKFSEEARLAVLKIFKADKEIPIAVDREAKPGTVINVPLPALAPGDYQVQWSALAADDGHVTKGRFSFSITVR